MNRYRNWLILVLMLAIVSVMPRCDCQDYAQVDCLRDSECESCSICFERHCEKDLEICWDQIDNDCDGQTDEECEVNCQGIECDNPPDKECVGGEILRTYSSPGVCIEGTCRFDASDFTCEEKCENGSCVGSTDCGNGVCDGDENVKNCPLDCRSKTWECGNGVCELGESAAVCPADCMSMEQGCGNGACEAGETPANCPDDCPIQGDPVCGNGVCEPGESVADCPNDCQTVPFFDGECEEGSTAGECILNEDADEQFHLDAEYLIGNAAVIAGDLDGDGLDDIAIGAAGDIRNGEDSGSVYIIYGRRNGFEGMSALGNADVVLMGERRDDMFGWSVAAAGSVNGYANLLVGAPVSIYPDQPAQGHVYIIPGGPDRLSGEIDVAGNFYFGQLKFIDSQTIGNAGRDVSGAGDVNGDGLIDILIGAPAWSQGATLGAAYLVYGGDSWDNPDFLNGVWLDDVACGWLNDLDHTYLGWRVSGAGDINGDGYSDILIGAPEDGSPEGMGSSTAYLIYGKGEQLIGTDVVSNADVTFVPGAIGYSRIGSEIGAAGDVDGDGYDDFVIGTPEDDNDQTKVYLFYGGPEKLSGEIVVSMANAIFTGDNISHKGPNQGGVGDVNGDGFSDLAFGSVYQGKEAVFLFLGGSSRFDGNIRMSNANAVFFIRSNDHCMGYTGSVVRGGGDVNGDGFDDFLIGAAGNCGGGGAQAYIYLVLGEGVR